MEPLTLHRLFDAHCHFRTEEMLIQVVQRTARYAEWATAMPNTRPRTVLSADDVVWYRDMIEDALRSTTPRFTPLMTIEIRDSTTPEMVVAAHKAGAVAGKVYPLGVTTNSDEGLRDFFNKNIRETFYAMQDVGMLLLVHGELDKKDTLVTEREEVFLPILGDLVEIFPGLKIVLEHVSTKVGVDLVQSLPDTVAATITAHHLCLTLNDVIGYGIQPHNGCMPMPKHFRDRGALIRAATSGNPKFFLGSDSAPHLKEKKECAHGACGVYTAPILPQLLAEVFEEAGCLEVLDDFASRFGSEFYGIPRSKKTVTLFKNKWSVPNQVAGVVPFKAGETLQWQLM